VTEAIDRVTDHLALKFAQSFDSGSGEVLLRVDNVNNLTDYRRVLDYLRGVHGVKQVDAEVMTANAVRFRLMMAGGRDAVLQVIALGNTLERVEHPQPLPLPAPAPSSALPQRPVPAQELPPGAASPASPSGQGEPGDTGDGTTGNTDTPAMQAPTNVAPQPPELVYRLRP